MFSDSDNSGKDRTSSAAAMDDNGWPSFSIIVPTFQRRELVCDAVRAIGQIRYPGAAELIVVVDGSTDGTADALRRIACPIPLRILEQENSGASIARNAGAGNARNDILLFLDDDMICDPDLVVEHARSHRAGADAVIGDVFLDERSPQGFMSDSNQRWIDSTRHRSELAPFDIFTGQLSVRRRVFQQIGGFDPIFTTGDSFSNEDADLGVALLKHYVVHHNPRAISKHRYVVSPSELMKRAPGAASGDLHFLRKHPEYSRQLFEARGISRPLARFVYRPLTKVPFAPKLLGGLAVRLADFALRTRFRSSRTLARFYSVARSLSFWSAMRAAGWFPAGEKLLVLCYHAIEDLSCDPVLGPYSVPREIFLEQLKSLRKRGYSFIGPKLLAEFLRGNALLPRRAALLTFDDGYPDLLALTRDVLQPQGIETLVFVVTGLSSGTNEWDQASGAKTINLLTIEQMKELSALGAEIGSHSRTHPMFPELTDEQRVSETSGSIADLEAANIRRPRFFTYPYGIRDEPSKAAARNAGFLAAFGPPQGRVTTASDHFDLPRVLVLAADRGWRFRLKTFSPGLVTAIDRVRALIDARLSKLTGLLHGRR